MEETHNLRLFACMGNSRQSYRLAGILFALLGAVLFSGKAVLVKIIYLESPIPVVSLLALRMLFALPFYLVMFFYALPSYKLQQLAASKNGDSKNRRYILLQTVAVGILGYYISSLLDFTGLQFISAGLERIILFLYPTFTVLFAAILFKIKISRNQFTALLVSYIGVLLAFVGDIQSGHSSNLVTGSILVFSCAITYALYVLLSGRLIQRMGASFFTTVAMISATMGVLLHFLLSGNSIDSLEHLSFRIYLLIAVMAFFTTVLPSYLLSAGLKRIGSSNVAIVSSIGPMATILQAYWFLNEKFGWMQVIGTLFVVLGVLIIGRKREIK